MLNSQAMNRYRAAPKANTKIIPAPYGGWNTRDALDAMPDSDAVTLTNWFPNVGSVDLRKGHAEHATGVGSGDVETVFEFSSGAIRRLIAFSSTTMYNATSAGAASSIQAGFSSGRWQCVNFNETMHFVNGADDPKAYDGSSVTTPSWSGSGLTNTTLIGVAVFKNRLFFWADDSQDFWYAAINAVSGTLTKFPLSRVSNLGGKIVAIGTWTLDSGTGVDDLFVIALSSGQVVVYAGTDPGDSTAWALQGIYNIGAPLGRRAIAKVGADLMIATKDDYVLLGQVLREGRLKKKPSKISGAASLAALNYASNFGWQIVHYPRGNMVLVNVPRVAGTTFDQHVVNTTTGAWAKFTGWNGACFCTYNDELYFGGEGGIVYKADTGTDDDDANITAEGQTAWTNFSTAANKLFTAVRPVISAEGDLTLGFGLGVDFKDILVEQPASSGASGSLWDVAEWDVAMWSAESTTRAKWYVASGVGRDVSVRLRVNVQGQTVKWYRTDYTFKSGVGF